MTTKLQAQHNPELDLVLEREIPVAPERVWQAWTRPEHLKPWFCPRPWQTIDCTIDLVPGGIFEFVMRGPDGEVHTHTCCYLEIVEHKKLAWTTALLPGFRPGPVSQVVPDFTAIIALEPHGTGTRYTATALHRDPSSRNQHAEMGFHEGWGTCVDQMVEMLTLSRVSRHRYR